jgi:hypothetical protein
MDWRGLYYRRAANYSYYEDSCRVIDCYCSECREDRRIDDDHPPPVSGLSYKQYANRREMEDDFYWQGLVLPSPRPYASSMAHWTPVPNVPAEELAAVAPKPKIKSVSVPDESVVKQDEEADANDKDAPTCAVCLENKPNCIIIPCNHVCVCAWCARVLGKNGNAPRGKVRCPICLSEDVKSIQRVFL